MLQVREIELHPNHGDKYYDVKVCKDCGSDADVEYFDRHLCEECFKDYD